MNKKLIESELPVSTVTATRAALNNNRSGGSDRVVPQIVKAIPPLLDIWFVGGSDQD